MEIARRAFHAELIAACRMPLLRQFCATLHDQSDRYRRIFLKTHAPDRNVADEHAAIADAVIEAPRPRRQHHAARSYRADRPQYSGRARQWLTRNHKESRPSRGTAGFRC